MKMFKLLAGATIGASALSAGIAHALPPGDYDGTVLNVFYGGATATDNILENNFLLISGGICAPGTIDVYRVSVTNRNNRVVFCSVTATQVAGFPAGGRKVAFHKESIGGSSNGVVPLINQTPLEFFNMANAAACTTTTPKAATATLNAYTEHTGCPDTTVSTIPNGGVSDVEPALSFPAPSAAGIATLNTVAGLDIIFGVPVSENLYRALQVAQGYISDDVTKTPTAKCVGGIDAPGCVPSLSKSQVRGLYTQALSDWSQFFVGNGTGTAENGTPLTAFAGVTPPTNVAQGNVADSKVFICRRVATSGSQATAESQFLKQRCQTGVRPFGGGNPVVGTVPAPFTARIAFGESTGDVRNCLAAHNTNKTWSVGVLSTEQSSSSGWRFVALDGAAPNIANVMNGRYDYFVSNTLNRRAVAPGVPAGETLALLVKLESNFANVAPIAAANASFQGKAWGDGGLLARYSSGAARVPDAVDGSLLTRANPINTQTHVVSGKINNCIDPVSSGSAGKGTLIAD